MFLISNQLRCFNFIDLFMYVFLIFSFGLLRLLIVLVLVYICICIFVVCLKEKKLKLKKEYFLFIIIYEYLFFNLVGFVYIFFYFDSIFVRVGEGAGGHYLYNFFPILHKTSSREIASLDFNCYNHMAHMAHDNLVLHQ